MSCKDTSLQGVCQDTTLDGLGAGGVANVPNIFPGIGAGGVPIELPLWDSVATEPAKLAGTSFRIYSVRRAKNRHPLYAEPSANGNWEYHGPWEMMGAFMFDQTGDTQASVEETGLRHSANAVLSVSRKEFEMAEAPEPKIGDVIHLWNNRPFSSDYQFWDVVKADRDGGIFTNEAFVQWTIALARRTTFDAGRKILGSDVHTPTHEDR